LREYIIGDEGYPLRPWLLSPYPPDVGGLNSIQDNFNYKHMCTRMVVEVAFARLKGAWRILHHTMWRPDLKKLPHLILCCCLLHNIMIDKGDDLQDGIALFGHHDENYRLIISPSHISGFKMFLSCIELLWSHNTSEGLKYDGILRTRWVCLILFWVSESFKYFAQLDSNNALSWTRQQTVLSIDPLGSYLRDSLANDLFFDSHP
jgi:hypothetical protein